MFICICKAVTDRDLRQAIDNGAYTRRQLSQCTGAGSVCGKCSCDIKQILDERVRPEPIMQFA